MVKSMVESGLLTIDGALKPTEVFQACNLGVDVIKVFPGSLGGPACIKAPEGPFPYIPMMTAGGVMAELCGGVVLNRGCGRWLWQ